jgi:hypothetical protein
MNEIQSFIGAVLGDTAATALRKAAERSEALGTVLGPRVIVGWLGFASHWSYRGEIPGLPGSTLTFQKNEDADLFDGSLSIGDDVFDFQNASMTQLAATLTVALGANQPVSKALKDTDLVGLGKNIDLLIKSRVVQMLKAAQQPSGTQAAPRGPLEPDEPKPQQKAPQNQQPKLPSQTKLKVTKSQAEQKCSVCEAATFRKGEFTGCWCLKELAKHASAAPADGGYEVTFGREWTKSNLRVLMDIIGTEGV